MKSLARGYFWWPKLDNDIEQAAKDCHVCLTVKNSPSSAPIYPWKWATRRMERVHMDFAEKDNQNFLVITDSYSKWLEIIIMPNITSKSLIEVLRPFFATHGFPELIVTDNGPSFASSEFAEFLKRNGINHMFSPPYHPASNGAAERGVQILKQALRTSKNSGLTLQHRVSNFLLVYRNTPHSTTGCTPAELFIKCKPRIRLSLLKPSLKQKVQKKQNQMKHNHDGKNARVRSFEPDDVVCVRNFRGGNKWQPGVIVQRLSSVTYSVKVNGQIRQAHIDHLIRGNAYKNEQPPDHTSQPPPILDLVMPPVEDQPIPVRDQINNRPAPVANPRRYPLRQNRRPPDRLDL